MKQLSGLDASFLHMELDGFPQHIGGVGIYNQSSVPGGKVRFKQILQMLESRLHLSPVFRRKLEFVPLGLGRPYWVEDPDFDLEYHVRHIALPQPGDWRQLCILSARLHAQPVSRDKPLWEMYVIEGLDNVEGLPPNCFALLTKLHHAAVDGKTATKFLNMMHDMTPEIADHGKAPPWIVEKPSPVGMLGRAYFDMWRKPGQVVDLVKGGTESFKRIRRGRENQEFIERDSVPKTRFQGKVSRHRVVDGRNFDFETIRAIKAVVQDATINDTMLAIVGGGMRKYLDSKGELPEQSLVTGCPIDVRTPEEQESGGNVVSVMNVGLRTDIEDPLERLATIHEDAIAAKRYTAALGHRLMVDVSDVMPGNVMALALRAASATGLTEANTIQNTIVTNVPGAPFEMYLCGAELIHSFALGVLVPNVGVFHVVSSNVQNKKGAITLSVTACREMLPDPDYYMDCMQEAYEELRDQALGNTSAQKKKRPAARKSPARKKK